MVESDIAVVSIYAMLMRNVGQQLADAVVQSPFSERDLISAVAPFQVSRCVRPWRIA
jgi:hypothetical protein